MSLATATLAAAALNAIKGELDGGFAYLFAGTVPATASEALDMDSTHTQVAILSVGADGVTGLTFDTSSNAVLAKAAAETWSGSISFDGANSGETTLTPTFWRFCPAGDTGREAGTGARLQGTVGGTNSGAEMILGTDTLTAGNTTSAAVFNVKLTGSA